MDYIQKMKHVDPRPIRESLQSTHPSLSTACIPAPSSRLDPYPREWMITSRFPIDIATPLDLASDSSGCTSGPTTPTDVTLLSCPSSLPLLCSPDLFPTESRLSQVQCSVSLVVPEFRTISPFDHLPFPTFGYCSLSVFTFAPPSYSLFRSLRSPPVPTCALPILPPDTSRTSRVQQLQLSFYKYCVNNQATIPISCV